MAIDHMTLWVNVRSAKNDLQKNFIWSFLW